MKETGMPGKAAPLAFATAALEGAREGLIVVSVPAPVRPPAAALSALRGSGASEAVAWLPPHGPRFVGIGSTAAVTGSVASSRYRREVEDLLVSIVVLSDDALPPVVPRLLGGFAFNPDAPLDPGWAPFGAGSLVLPRWTYGQEDGHAWVSLAAEGPLAAEDRSFLLAELSTLLERLERVGKAEGPKNAGGNGLDLARSASNRGWSGESQASWNERVEAILEEIVAGRMSKVVAARVSECELGSPLDPTAMLRALGTRFSGCTGFYVEDDGAAFLGATPERLVRVADREVVTEALAGSAPPGEGRTLLASAKDRREHELVLREMISVLDPLCERVQSGETRPLELPNISHLRTPIRARARSDVGLLDLVATLHPTPAVGGVPREPALTWIQQHEPVGRGWYAGPVGWVDANGDGEFGVAIRCALLDGTIARLYAGAGIVRGSDPGSEWKETESKIEAVRTALSVQQEAGGAVSA